MLLLTTVVSCIVVLSCEVFKDVVSVVIMCYKRGRTVSRQTKKQTTWVTTYFPKREPSPDIAGAFEKVPHVGALHKMCKMGATGLALSWLHDYLSTRHLQLLLVAVAHQCFPPELLFRREVFFALCFS